MKSGKSVHQLWWGMKFPFMLSSSCITASPIQNQTQHLSERSQNYADICVSAPGNKIRIPCWILGNSSFSERGFSIRCARWFLATWLQQVPRDTADMVCERLPILAASLHDIPWFYQYPRGYRLTIISLSGKLLSVPVAETIFFIRGKSLMNCRPHLFYINGRCNRKADSIHISFHLYRTIYSDIQLKSD